MHAFILVVYMTELLYSKFVRDKAKSELFCKEEIETNTCRPIFGGEIAKYLKLIKTNIVCLL